VFIGMGVLVLGGIFPCFGDFNVVVCGGGLNGYVAMCVLIVCFRTCCSSCGVCKFDVRFTRLCTHIIDVRDGSTRL
jgi:hypothetical protein